MMVMNAINGIVRHVLACIMAQYVGVHHIIEDIQSTSCWLAMAICHAPFMINGSQVYQYGLHE
jgi:hypothetical protein